MCGLEAEGWWLEVSVQCPFLNQELHTCGSIKRYEGERWGGGGGGGLVTSSHFMLGILWWKGVAIP